MNDLGTGRALTSSWGGLNDVLHNRDITIGLGQNNYSFGGVGGTYSLDTRASAQREGLTVSYSNANRNFRNRLMATYNTGVLKSGWAVTASFSKRWATEGYVPGTTYDGYSYLVSVDKHFGNTNVLSFTTFGSPTKEGLATGETQEAYNLVGSHYYNSDWGYQNGVKRNAFVRNNFQPQFILNDRWKITDKSTLIMAVGASFGKNKQSGLEYSNAPNPNPAYYKNMPSYLTDSVQQAFAEQQWRTNVNVRQINWDNLYAVNRNSQQYIPNVNGVEGNNETVNLSRYAVYNKVQDTKRFSFNATDNTNFNEHISLSVGLKYQLERTENYDEIADLLGGSTWYDVNQYAPLSYPGNDSVAQNDLRHFNRLVGVGGKYDHDYVTVNHHLTAFAQPEFHFKKVDFFVAAQLEYTSFWRNGLFQNGLFPTTSYGVSPAQNFFNYQFKGGLTYKIDTRNFLYANGAYFTQAPYLYDAYLSINTRNSLAPGLSSEKVYSGEAGYMYKSPNIKLRASFFVSQFNNQTQTNSYFDDDLSTYVNNTLTNMNSRHLGGEIGFEAKVYKGFGVSAVGTMGQYIYTNRPNATITDDNTSTVLQNDETVYLKNYHVGGTPQLATSVGVNYHSQQGWFVDLFFNYYGNNYVELNPQRRTTESISNLTPANPLWGQILDQEKLPAAFTMDMFAGYTWLMNNQFSKMKKYKYYMVFSLNVTNITNNKNFITRGYEQLEFDARTKNLAYYPNKYVYAYGANYLFTVAFRMN